MTEQDVTGESAFIASQFSREGEYWLEKLSGDLVKSSFPYLNDPGRDFKTPFNKTGKESRKSCILETCFSKELALAVIRTAGNSDSRLHMILAAGLTLLLDKYTGNKDIIIGSPIDRQDFQGDFINTVLVLRNLIHDSMSFRELLFQVRNTILKACENQNYPLETILYDLKLPSTPGDFPLFDTALLLENIHDRKYLRHIPLNMLFFFQRVREQITCKVEYNASLYDKPGVERIFSHFSHLLERALANVNLPVSRLNILSPEERKQVLVLLNDTSCAYPADRTIHELFAIQVKKTPDQATVIVAVTPGVKPVQDGHVLTYNQLNHSSNQLARTLRKKGVKPDVIIGILLHRSIELITAILGVLKAGGAYLPIDPAAPEGRIITILEESQSPLLLTSSTAADQFSFVSLQGTASRSTGTGQRIRVRVTNPRPQIKDFDSLPLPDRSLVDNEKYNLTISDALVKHCITLQATRGCPYHCAYCHKIWPKSHVYRSAENIFKEINIYYEMGIRRFAFVDDIFNLEQTNSRRFFELIIKNRLNLQLFFPTGVRGDLLTRDYIDSMVEAGTISLALALETASPRLQKLIGKNLDIEKLRENIEYFCKAYPHVMLDLFAMHGFPTETGEEAIMTLDFIKSLEWLHFPVYSVLKIYSNTPMAKLAMQNGIPAEAIARSEELAFHELPETLPFEKSFTSQCQADFVNNYFLKKERLVHVLPHQYRYLSQDEFIRKYDSYFTVGIKNLKELYGILNVEPGELGALQFQPGDSMAVPGLNEKINAYFPCRPAPGNALRILLLDLSQSFGHEAHQLNDLVEAPLGLMNLLTYLNRELRGKIQGKIAKSHIDFDNYQELIELLERFKPQVIGIRTLSFYKKFFHRTIAVIRQWGADVPVITGGPYATSGYSTMLQDVNIDLAVLGEGEITFCRVIEEIIANNGKLPGEEVLKKINGLAYVTREAAGMSNCRYLNREIILMDAVQAGVKGVKEEYTGNPEPVNTSADLAYVIFTSGSTGRPKGVLMPHRGVVNYTCWAARHYIKNSTLPVHFPLYTSISFDLTVTSIFTPLVTGGAIIIYGENTEPNNKDFFLETILADHRVGIIKATPSHLKIIRDYLLSNSNNQINRKLKSFILGGEELETRLAKDISDGFNGKIDIFNEYGPTEAAVGCMIYKFDQTDPGKRPKTTLPIGKPASNVKIYLLDRNQFPVPIGVNGEIFIGGDGLARGYINNTQLSFEKFINKKLLRKMAGPGRESTPLLEKNPPGRIYRTGDLGRWLPEGIIEFTGRIDSQVKIRGYRVELTEIQICLTRHKAVKEALVTVRQDQTGSRNLTAYIVPGPATAPVPRQLEKELRHYLINNLPEYMIPGYIVFLPEIPLTSNGKIHWKALPEPSIGEKGELTSPRDQLERQLLDIWVEVLEVEKGSIGIDTNFFQLGGHSLKAAVLAARLHKIFNVKVPLAQIFGVPTIRGLAEFLKEARIEEFVPLRPAEKMGYYPLSSAQKRLYILQQLDPASTVYNIPEILEVIGDLDRETVAALFKKLIRRHESLRTSFELSDGTPVQRVHDEVEEEMEPEIHYSETPGAPAEQVDLPVDFTTSAITGFIRPFHLSKAPLLRSGLLKLENKKHILMLDIHHIIIDGVSHNILKNEFIALYQGIKLKTLRIQYKDFSQWQHRQISAGKINSQQDYWLKEYEYAGEIPVLYLPADKPRPAVQDFTGSTLGFLIEPGKTTALQQLAAQQEVTLFMVLAAVFYIFLSKLSSQETIIIGTPVAGRRHADLEQTIGMFVNTLAIKNHPHPAKPFTHFLDEVKEKTLSAFENQDYPFEDLVDQVTVNRDISRNPLFDVMFSYQEIELPSKLIPDAIHTPLAVKPCQYETVVSRFDLTLNTELIGETLFFTFEYCTKLFQKNTLQRFSNYFKGITRQLIENPSSKIAAIEIITPEEKKQILLDFNDTPTEFPRDKKIHELFTQQVKKYPDRVALVQANPKHNRNKKRNLKNLHITYNHLDEQSNRLACLMVKKGTQPGCITALMIERSPEMLIAITAILKTQCAYLPIDPTYPPDRIEFMLKDSNANALVTPNALAKKTGKNPVNIYIDPFKISNFSTSQLLNFSTSDSSSLAYIIYTSGSTGNPKGVMIEHPPVVNLIHALQNLYPLAKSDNYLLKTPYIFDVSITELFGWFPEGGQLTILDPGKEKDPRAIIDTIVNTHVTHINFVPSMFNAFVETLNPENISHLSSLKYIFLAGEALPSSPIKKFQHLNSSISIENIYGPTEATVYSCNFKLSTWNNKGNIPIGKPLPNTRLFILDKNNCLQPVGITGELCLNGINVARGYLNNPVLTSKKFRLRQPGGRFLKKRVVSPPGPAIFRKNFLLMTHVLYRTGDLGRWRHDGNVEFLGRMDSQVKIRGFRIELGEIENFLRKHELIKDAVVLLFDHIDFGDSYLCAYIVSDMGISPAELKEFLAKRLPLYMIPSRFLPIKYIPLTPGGKIDRSALPTPEPTIPVHEKNKYNAPRDEIETRLAEIWSQLLGIEEIGRDDHFFNLGGHSLKANILVNQVSRTFDADVPLRIIFKIPTLKGLANFIKKTGKRIFKDLQHVEKREYYPLSSAQKRLFFLDRFEQIHTSYNMFHALKIKGKPAINKLEYAFNRLIQRHDVFRTAFILIDNQPVQKITEPGIIDFKIHTPPEKEKGKEKAQEKDIQQLIEDFVRPFDLSRPPLLRAAFSPISQQTGLLLFDLHHIIADGTSMGIIINEIARLYSSETVTPLKFQYKDFTAWQNHLFKTGKIKKQQDYWQQIYTDANQIPRLNLPYDKLRPHLLSFKGNVFNFKLEPQETSGFKKIAASNNVTLYMNLLAAFNVLLYRYTGQQDIIVGTGIAGRRHADLQNMIGMFVNTLAMRNHPHQQKTYTAFLKEVKETGINAYENQDLQFEELVDQLNLQRNPARHPVFDISLVFQDFEPANINIDINIDININTGTETQELHFIPLDYPHKTSKFDITLFAYKTNREMYFDIEYCTDLFHKETIQRLARHLVLVINQVIKNPHIRIGNIDIVTEQEKHLLINEFNKTETPCPNDKTIDRLVSDQVAVTPHHVALAAGNACITYTHLEKQANQLALYLTIGLELPPGERIGILLNDPVWLGISILGTLKAGATYIPLEPGNPETRLQHIINETGLCAIISRAQYIRTLNRLQWKCETLHTFLCIDSWNIHAEIEEKDILTDQKLWDYVAETATDEITGGGWQSSFTGKPFSVAEMEEYGQNILQKLTPLLHKNMHVLEIGCASGISMYRIAPGVGIYYGTDLSYAMIQNNIRRVREKKYPNIELYCLPAHEIHKIKTGTPPPQPFELVIMNSVIQAFSGHNYLRSVISGALELMANKGYIFIGDVMDLDLENQMIRDLVNFKKAHINDINDKKETIKTKTDFSAELFLTRTFFQDIKTELPGIQEIEFSGKIHTIENELTRYRYDVLITVDKSQSLKKSKLVKKKHKQQHDIRTLAAYDTDRSISKSRPREPAYIIYTSGSSGRPKGVIVEHRGVVNMLKFRRAEYRLDPGHVSLQLFSYAFDGFVAGFFTPLISGSRVVMPGQPTAGDVPGIIKLIVKHRITHFISVPALYRAIIEIITKKQALGLKVVTLAGDVIPPRLPELSTTRNRTIEIVNEYGLTETSVMSAIYRNLSSGEIIRIGHPIWNTTIHILDSRQRLLPVGAAGELYISGIGTARGYLNNPGLTLERFLNYKLQNTVYKQIPKHKLQITNNGGYNQKLLRKMEGPGGETTRFLEKSPPNRVSAPRTRRRQKQYKTGDLGRWLADGNIQFLGRIDLQVKIRGYRIELKEIEHRLLEYQGITGAVVSVGKKTDPCLCAYFTAPKKIDVTRIKIHLTRGLPGYMVPAYIEQLDNIPLNPHGKVDRNKLPQPGLQEDSLPAELLGDIEKTIRDLWSDLLGIPAEQIPVNANFFELGGHSLKAALLVARIHQALQVKIPLSMVFEFQTIKGLSERIRQLQKEDYAGIEPVETKEYHPVSPIQKQYYMLQEKSKETTYFNMPWSGEISIDPDKEKLEQTFKKLIQRHDSLRTSFHTIGNEPVQKVHNQVEFAIESMASPPGINPSAAILHHSFVRPFDLSRAPLLRAGISQLEKGKSLLIIDMHHIISDGTSMGIFLEEFALIQRGETLPLPRVRYKDYCQWLNGENRKSTVKKQKSYWREVFSRPAPGLQLPADYDPPEKRNFQTCFNRFEISIARTRALKELAQQQHATLYMILLAIFNVFLFKLTGQQDIIVSSIIAGRKHADLQRIIGLFIDALLLRNQPKGEKTFTQFLKEVKKNTLQALENQEYPIIELLEELHTYKNANRNRNPGHQPITTVCFVLQDRKFTEPGIPGIKSGTQQHEIKVSPFELTLEAVETGTGRLSFNIEYATQRFKPETITHFISYFKTIVASLPENPAKLIKELPEF